MILEDEAVSTASKKMTTTSTLPDTDMDELSDGTVHAVGGPLFLGENSQNSAVHAVTMVALEE